MPVALRKTLQHEGGGVDGGSRYPKLFAPGGIGVFFAIDHRH